LIVAAIIIGLGLLWYNERQVISAVVIQMKLKEIDLISWVAFHLDSVLKAVHLPTVDQEHLYQIQQVLLQADTENIKLDELMAMMGLVGIYLAYPIIVVTTFMAIYLVFYHLNSRYCERFTMQTFRETEKNNWVYISPILKEDLVKKDLDEGIWAMSSPPLDFIRKYKLGRLETENGEKVIKIDRGLSARVFSSQMGPLWGGLESLPPHAQCLFAIFAAKGSDAVEEANALMRQVAASSGGDTLDYSGTRQLLVKYISNNPAVGRAVGPHAYILTVMASMLELARTSGVVATAEFHWLKKVDRPLWYMLNSVGRQTPFLEVSGPFAHWLVEKRLRRALKVPVITEAIGALAEAVAQVKYNPESMGDV
jgi:intracellular multiplication protein IcmP